MLDSHSQWPCSVTTKEKKKTSEKMWSCTDTKKERGFHFITHLYLSACMYPCSLQALDSIGAHQTSLTSWSLYYSGKEQKTQVRLGAKLVNTAYVNRTFYYSSKHAKWMVQPVLSAQGSKNFMWNILQLSSSWLKFEVSLSPHK